MVSMLWYDCEGQFLRASQLVSAISEHKTNETSVRAVHCKQLVNTKQTIEFILSYEVSALKSKIHVTAQLKQRNLNTCFF